MKRINIWQCKDWCCENRPHSQRYWFARSTDFDLYEEVSTWQAALTLANSYAKKVPA